MSSVTEPSEDILQRDLASLQASYNPRMRLVDPLCIGLSFLLMGVVGVELLGSIELLGWPLVVGLLASWLLADFGSGFVHWVGDTWGTVDTPILGRSLIRKFREHHVDQTAITRHSFVYRNGTNCMATLPFLALALAIDLDSAGPLGIFVVVFCWSISGWGVATNEIHCWAHQASPGLAVRLLQKSRLILSPEAHAKHHSSPYMKGYCITTGWMNPVLDAVGFWRFAERTFHAMSGELPRQDDLGEAAAGRLFS